jgi:large conductance mechanosensitive channel
MAGKGLVSEFKEFVLRGNVIDLAVAVVIGAAFGTVVAALVKDLLTPLIAAIGGKPDFSHLFVTVNHSKLLYGDFLNAVISFLSIALVVFLFVVKPMNVLLDRRKKAMAQGAAPEAATLSDEAVLLGEIRDLLRAGAGSEGRIDG